MIQLNQQQTHFLRILLSGVREISESEVKIRKEVLNLESFELPCIVACIAPDFINLDYQSIDKTVIECERFIHSFLIKKNKKFYTVVNDYENILVLLKVNNREDVEDLFAQLQQKISLVFSVDVFIGIGSVVNQYQEVCISASEAFNVLAYKYQYSDRGVINIENIIQFRHNLSYSNDERINKVIACFQEGDLSKMSMNIDELVKEIRYRPKVSNTSIKRTMIELAVHILHIASSAGVDVDELLNVEDPYRWILQQDETPVIKDWIMQLSVMLSEKIMEQQKVSENAVINKSCRFIEDHLQDSELGLQMISESCRLSGPYFSQLFKKEMGIGLSSYITRLRVEKAKEMLQSSNLKNEDIARQLGFTRSNYFNRIFKNETGITPGTYRKKHKSLDA